MGDTTIAWTEKTWNPIHGCSKVSPGCAHCYAEGISRRFGHTRAAWTPENATANVQLHPDRLGEPLKWRKPSLVFVNSMADLFHELVPLDYVAAVFGVMAAASQHTFQVLTKRPDRMRDLLLHPEFARQVRLASGEIGHMAVDQAGEITPLPNVWVGVSIENRRYVARADALRETPAAVRFISAEPLLGPLVPSGVGCYCFASEQRRDCAWPDGHRGTTLSLEAIDWLIVGGESGAGARRMDAAWVRDLQAAASHTGTAVFVKQLGTRLAAAHGIRGKAEDPTLWPDGLADLNVREWPKGTRR